jgi:hypothetical protein
MKSSITKLAVIRLSTVSALIVFMFGLAARAQNPVSDWNAISVNTVVITAKKLPLSLRSISHI